MKPRTKKYNYFYKITNNINNHFYYGVHSTDNLNDGYIGSGKRLHYAYKKYGIENFTKEILKFFDTAKDAYEYESEIVSETLIKDPNCYNISHGGFGGAHTLGMVAVKNEYGENFLIPVDDIRYINGELVGVNKNRVVVKDENGNRFTVDLTDPRYLSGEVVNIFKGKNLYLDKNGNIVLTNKDDPRYVSGELLSYSKHKITVKDKYNKFYKISVDDPRYLSGELKPIWFGRKHKQETIEKCKKTFKEIGHQQGEKNSQFGTCWITKDCVNKKIKKEDLKIFEKDGWKKGRFIK